MRHTSWRGHRRLLFAILGSLLLVPPPPSAAQTSDGVGVRALGMAGAFVAVADDATAIYWNPAGLATGALFSFVIDRESFEVVPDDPVVRASRGTSWIAALGTPVLGLGYYRLHESAVERQGLVPGSFHATSLVTHNTSLGVTQSLTDRIVVGSVVRFVRGVAVDGPIGGVTAEKALERVGELVGRADNTFDLDLGLMASLGRLRAGLSVRNLRKPGFETVSGQELQLDRRVRAGLAVLPDPDLTIAFDAELTTLETPTGDRRPLAIGAEGWLLDRRLGIRGGVRADTVGDARPVLAGGVSVGVMARVTIDGRVTRGHHEGDTGWGLAGRVTF